MKKLIILLLMFVSFSVISQAQAQTNETILSWDYKQGVNPTPYKFTILVDKTEFTNPVSCKLTNLIYICQTSLGNLINTKHDINIIALDNGIELNTPFLVDPSRAPQDPVNKKLIINVSVTIMN